jgi:RHS repeat-associated protein
MGKALIGFFVALLALNSGLLLYGQSGIYDRTGIVVSHGTHGSLPEENIDLFTGNVTLRYRDVFLPGPEGLNVEVWRVYNSKILKDRQSGNPSVQAYHKSWVGIGWTMHMGMVHQETTSKPVIEFPDGRLETAFQDKNDPNSRHMTRDFLRYDKTLHKLYFQNGVIWTFGATATITRADGTSDPVRLVTTIENSFGYSITITYNSGTPTLKTITDSYGRIVTFTSTTTSPRKLTRITLKDSEGNDKYINYSVGTFTGSGYYRLDSVTFPWLPATTFEYNSGTTYDYELKKVTTSYGGVLEYSYINQNFYFNGIALDSRVVSQKKITFTPGNQATWNFTYPSYQGVTTGTVQVQGPLFNTSVTYNAYDPAAPWKIGSINSFGYSDNSFTKSHEWTCQEISNDTWSVLGTNMGTAKGLLCSTVTQHKTGGAYFKEEYRYEHSRYTRYGLPSKVLQYVNNDTSPLNSKTTAYYFVNKPSYEDRFLLTLPSVIAEFDTSGTKIKENLLSYYEENGKWGAVQQFRVWKGGSDYADWNQYYFPPDQWQRIQIQTIGPGGYNTTKKYRYGIEEESKRGDITTVTRIPSQYDSSVSQEILQDGGLLKYRYDSLGRVTLVDWPDDRNDETTVWRPGGENKSETTRADSQMGNNKITRFWDGFGRDLGSIEEGDSTTLYSRRELDAENRLHYESKGAFNIGDKYHYHYNAAGELIDATDPSGRTTQITLAGKTKTVRDPRLQSTVFEYSHLPGLPTSVTDPQGHPAVYSYDSFGRLTGVDYNNHARIHSFSYDRNDNLTSETHPETGLINYSYYDTNWLYEKNWGGAVSRYIHNLYDGTLYLVTSGDGSSTEDEIGYLHGPTGRVIRVKSNIKGWERDPIKYDSYGNVKEETIIIPGLLAKTIKYEYDRNNNLTKTTYPDQNYWAKTTHNGLLMPESLTFNSDNSILANSATYGAQKALTSLSLIRNGTLFSASYFPSAELNSTSLTKAGVPLYQASYLYDGNGNIQSITSTAPAPVMNASFSYDALNRLATATYSSGRVGAFTYTYDEYGNMRTVQENGVAVFNKTYDAGNRIIGDAYDQRGNLLAMQDQYLYWDKQNQLVRVTNMAGEVLGKYLYDERGLRLMAVPPLPEIYVGTSSGELKDGIDELIFECPVGQHADTTLTIKNDGDASLELTGTPKVAISGVNADQFSVQLQPASPLAPFGGSTTCIIRFNPTSAGKKIALLSIANNDINENPYDIVLKGNLQPEIEIADVPNGGSWDFCPIRIGQSSQQPFMIQNLGEAVLLIPGDPRVQITGDDYSQFSVEQQPANSINPGGYSFFIIRFAPVVEGPITAEVTIENSDLNENPYTFTLQGTGQQGGAAKMDALDLDLTSPDGDEKLVAGETRTISWTGGQATQFVRIEYSTDNGTTYATIAERAPNTGKYDWVVPPLSSPVCLVRISDADGAPTVPISYRIEFDLKVKRALDSANAGGRFTIRLAVPDAETQTTQVADLAMIFDMEKSSESVALNYTESAAMGIGVLSGDWRHVQVEFDLEAAAASVSIDGRQFLEKAPLLQLPKASTLPEINVTYGTGLAAEVWMDNLAVRFQDRSRMLAGAPEATYEPIVGDAFDRYFTGEFPLPGGWLFHLPADLAGEDRRLTDDASVSKADSGQTQADQTAGLAIQPSTFANINNAESVTPVRSFRFKLVYASSAVIAKSFQIPARRPYDISSANFSISQVDELAQIMDKMIDEWTSARAKGSDSNKTPTSSASNQSSGAMSTLSAPRTGSYFIYAFDGRLLAEYDLYGTCLRDYIYMGNLLIAEYVPASGQYYYYTKDQIGTTRVVTNDTGSVVYAEAHDPYGGLQKSWANAFDPKRKYSDKERDQETGLDYFGARYYSNPNYRWCSLDPVLDRSKAIVDAQRWNIYAYCSNNPINNLDPDGRVLICDRMYGSIIAIAGPAAARLSIVDGKLDVSKLTKEDLKDEGVRLLYELAMSSYVYIYSEGPSISTAAGDRPVDGAENLAYVCDDRWAGGQPARYLPPNGAHGIVTINPCCAWTDKNGRSIKFEAIVFHELSEVFGKVEFGWQYKEAHKQAGIMEEALLGERPDFTVGSAGGAVIRIRF